MYGIPRGSHRDNRHPIEFNANIIVPLPTKIGFGSHECVISAPNYNAYRVHRASYTFTKLVRRLQFFIMSRAMSRMIHLRNHTPLSLFMPDLIADLVTPIAIGTRSDGHMIPMQPAVKAPTPRARRQITAGRSVKSLISYRLGQWHNLNKTMKVQTRFLKSLLHYIPSISNDLPPSSR